MIKIFLLILFIIYIIFFTPQYLSDIIHYIISGNIKIIYYYKNNIIKYSFNHYYYDGDLMSYYIKNDLVKYEIINNPKIHYFEDYQFLENNKIYNYSLFVSTISQLLYKMINKQKRTLNIGIIVSIRHQLKNKLKKGNFLKFAYCTINENDTIYTICKKINYSIQYTKNNNHLIKNLTIYDYYQYKKIDYLFNNWRNLSTIKTINKEILYRQADNYVDYYDIVDLINYKNKKYILLDYINNYYVISNISNF